MKVKTLISFIDNKLSTLNYPTIKAISFRVGVSKMSSKEAREYFYGHRGLSMYQVIISKIEKEDQEFYTKVEAY